VARKGRVGSNPTPGANNIAVNEPRCFGYLRFRKSLAP